MDGSYKRIIRRKLENTEVDYKQQSFLTLLIYLNEDYEGGETRFFPDKQHCRFLRDVENKVPTFIIKPKTGRALVNIHNVLHEGSSVTRGTKYVVRTDILFEKRLELNPKLEKFAVISTAKNQAKKSDRDSIVFVGEWEKMFEPSCKAYHD